MHPGADSAEKAMKARGTAIMGVDQDRSTHRFTSLPDGGRIELTSNEEDSAATVRIRKHFGDIEKAFAAGDFSIPAMVHDQNVPGTDRAAREAIHRFLLFQRTEHHAGQ